MLEVNKIIIELLKIHDCVIFPNFGGFVAQYTSAKIDSTKTTFTPPFKQILFNKNLTNNDGLLVNAISQKCSISFHQADKNLSILLENINNELDSTSKYTFEGLGVLFRNQGVLNFNQQSENLLLDSFGLKVMNIDEFNSVKPSEKIINISQSPFNKYKIKNWVATAAAIILLFYSAWIPLKTDLFNNSDNFSYSELNPFTFKKNISAKNLESNLKLSKTKAVDLPLKQEEVIKNANTIITGNIINKEEVSSTKIVDKKIKVETSSLSIVTKNNVKSTNYEVIVGSFSSENNAKKLIKKLRKKSFKARQLALIENFFRVSIGNFNKKENALKFQKQIRKKFKISSWILAN